MLRDKEQMLSLLKEFSTRTSNVLVVDSDLITLIDMEKIMRQYAYQVKTYPEADKAIAYLRNSAHEINLVIWDFHMPKINGLEALKIIGSKMDLPVVIMSDDRRRESVMNATIHGACDYLMKPVSEKVIATIWQHILRKKMTSKLVVPQPVQSDLVPSHGVVQANNDPVTKSQDSGEQNIDINDQSTNLDQLFVSDLDETNSLYLDDDDLKVIYQDKGKQNIDKDGQNATEKPRMMSPDSTQSDQSNLVIIDGIDLENSEQNMDKKDERISKKPRLMWTTELHHKFLRAIERCGGMENAKSLKIYELMEGKNIEGLTKINVSSHLQKHRLNLAKEKIRQETLEEAPLSLQGSTNPHTPLGCGPPSSLQGSSNAHTHIGQSPTYRPLPLLGSRNVHTGIGPSTAYRPLPLLGSSNAHTGIGPSTAHRPLPLLGSSNGHTGIGPSTAYRPLPLLSSSNAHTEIGQSPAYRSTLLVPSNAHTEIGQFPTDGPSSLMGPSNSYSAIPSVINGGDMNQIHQNQYPSTGYLTANSNQFMTSPVPSWPNSDNHLHHDLQQQQQQQQYQYPPQQMENNKEPEQAYGDDDIELIYPELPYDPNEYLLKGNHFHPN